MRPSGPMAGRRPDAVSVVSAGSGAPGGTATGRGAAGAGASAPPLIVMTTLPPAPSSRGASAITTRGRGASWAGAAIGAASSPRTGGA